MTQIRLDAAYMPAARWNTHIACLAGLSRAAARGLDIIDLAGITGLAFRTALTRQVTPAGLYLSWAWAPSFTLWLDALGLDAGVSAHHTGLPSFGIWFDRQCELINQSLDRGLPAMHWDNTGFGLILGRENGRYLLSGVPDFTVHPAWFEQSRAQPFCTRLLQSQPDETPSPALARRDELVSIVEPEALFAVLHGVCRFDEEEAAVASIYRAANELAGRIEYPRIRDNLHSLYEPQFGTAAITRWREELKTGRVHAFGMIQSLQSLGEARRWAAEYLKRVTLRIDKPYRSRIEQAAHFFTRITEHLRPLLSIFNPPLDSDNQLTRNNLEKCRSVLYQVQQTEQTAGRLLSSVATELFD